ARRSPRGRRRRRRLALARVDAARDAAPPAPVHDRGPPHRPRVRAPPPRAPPRAVALRADLPAAVGARAHRGALDRAVLRSGAVARARAVGAGGALRDGAPVRVGPLPGAHARVAAPVGLPASVAQPPPSSL